MLARIHLQTDDRRRVVIYPDGGLCVEEFIALKCKAHPEGAWYAEGVDGEVISEGDIVAMLEEARDRIAAQIEKFQPATDEVPAGELFDMPVVRIEVEGGVVSNVIGLHPGQYEVIDLDEIAVGG